MKSKKKKTNKMPEIDAEKLVSLIRENKGLLF
jgi:hypothetical protein